MITNTWQTPSHVGEARVVELRQYALVPGSRSTLIELFQQELIEPQEAAGMVIGGIFIDLEDPNNFVWLRGFPSMDARRRALECFYDGPVWKAHKDAANATMVNSDNVLLLHATRPEHPLAPPQGKRADVGSPNVVRDRIEITIYEHRADEDLTNWLSTDVHAHLERCLGVSVATWRTNPAPNTFPQLPVRDDNVFVWTAAFRDETSWQEAERRLSEDPVWADEIQPILSKQIERRQQLHLEPTGRSHHQLHRPGNQGT